MTDQRSQEPEFAHIDAALRALPLEDPPPALAQGVMSAVRAGAAQPRARLTWLRFALLLLLSEALIVVVLAARYLPPGFDLYFKIELDFWLLRLQSGPNVLPILQGGALLAAGLALLSCAGFNLIKNQAAKA